MAAALTGAALTACGGYQLPARHDVVAPTPTASAAATTPPVRATSVPTAVPVWPSATQRLFTPDPTPDTHIDLCAQPSGGGDRVSAVLTATSAATAGASARGEINNLHNSDGDGNLDIKAFGCGLDSSTPNRYYADLLAGADQCTLTSSSQVWVQMGYLSTLDDNRTLYTITEHSNAAPVPQDSWMAIYDAGPGGANRDSAALVFCGRLTS